MNLRSFINNKSINNINANILKSTKLSQAFGSVCYKILLEDGKKFVIKIQYEFNNNGHSSVYNEGKSLLEMNKMFPDIFPKIFQIDNDFILMQWIENNGEKNELSENDFAIKLAKIHSIKNDNFGYKFDSQIGGLIQPNSFEKSWINFYKTKRLQMIFDIINKNNKIELIIIKKIESIINNIENYIPECKNPSLIHGDLWAGNILFNNSKLVGLIDPGIYYANIELELSYLILFNTVSKKFFDMYKAHIQLDKGFEERSGIYELYYALLNFYLWDKNYITKVDEIVKKYV